MSPLDPSPRVNIGPYRIVARVGAGGPPRLAERIKGASYGAVAPKPGVALS